MTILLIALSLVAAYLTRGSGLWAFAVANAVASVWANGVMANFGPHEAQEIPDWAAAVSMATAVLSGILVVTALILR